MERIMALIESNVGTIIEFIGVLVALVTFFISSVMNRKATEEQTYRDTLRATLHDFSELRRKNKAFQSELDSMNEEEKLLVIRNFLTDLERFAVGCNMNAYDINIVNRMSGGSLISQYRKHLKPYIENARRMLSPNSTIRSKELYIEVELMMKKLYEVRNVHFDDIYNFPEDERILERFLSMPISSTDEVFTVFKTLPNAFEANGTAKKRYLYIPGERKDRCLLVAHADTFYDFAYHNQVFENSIVLEKGKFHGTNSTTSIGADDRSGCAILWLLRNSGHSLLITDGEEHGQIGASFLKESNPQLFREINEHSFILEFDRKGSQDYKYYDIPVTEEFKEFIKKETGFMLATGKGKTDIVILCSKVCGVNLSVGYYNEHKAEESLDISDWKKTLSIVRSMLEKPLKKYSILT